MGGASPNWAGFTLLTPTGTTEAFALQLWIKIATLSMDAAFHN